MEYFIKEIDDELSNLVYTNDKLDYLIKYNKEMRKLDLFSPSEISLLADVITDRVLILLI